MSAPILGVLTINEESLDHCVDKDDENPILKLQDFATLEYLDPDTVRNAEPVVTSTSGFPTNLKLSTQLAEKLERKN
jgi:hypothetical protein